MRTRGCELISIHVNICGVDWNVCMVILSLKAVSFCIILLKV